MNTEVSYLVSSSINIFFVVTINWMLALYTYNCLMKKQHSLIPYYIQSILKTLLFNVLIQNILGYYYKNEYWWDSLNFIFYWIYFFIFIGLSYWTFEEEMLRLFLVLIFGELPVGFLNIIFTVLINPILGKVNSWLFFNSVEWIEWIIIIIGAILYTKVIKLWSPFLNHLINQMAQYRKIMWIVVVLFLQLTCFSWIRSDDYQIISMMIAISFSGLIIGLVYFVQKYMERIKKRNDFIHKQKDLMVIHYTMLFEQIAQIEQSRELMANQMEEIVVLENPEQKKEKIASYTAQLKEVYEKIQAGIYCDDWLVDAIFSRKVQEFKENGIILEINMHGYRRGKVEEADLAQIIMLLLGYCEEQMTNPNQNVREASKSEIEPVSEFGHVFKFEPKIDFSKTIHLELTMMKKQLIIKYSYPYAFENKKLKRKLRKNLKVYLEKYDGNCNGVSEGVRESRKQTIIIMLLAL